MGGGVGLDNVIYLGRYRVPSKNYRPKIESTEAKFRYPRNITEAEFWLMLHPAYVLVWPFRCIPEVWFLKHHG